MSMWHDFTKTAAYGEDPERPSDFIYHVPEYDAAGNLVSGDPDYFLDGGDQPPSRHSNSAQGTHGVGTTIKGDIDQAGPAEWLRNDNAHMDSPASWGPELAGPLDDRGQPVGEPGSYPYPSGEQLKRDEHFAAGRPFNWPGGRDKAEDHHNGVSSRGFTLENSGTEEEPVPTYRHTETGARIEPSGDEDAPWQLSGRPGDTEKFFSTGAAAMSHDNGLKEDMTKRYTPPAYNPPSRDSDYSPRSNPSWQSGRGRERSQTQGPRGPRGHGRPTNVDDAARHAVGMASYDSDQNSVWNMNNQGTTFGGHPDHIPSNTTGQLEDWTAAQYRADKAAGKINHVIYHYQTPLAWLKTEPGESGNPDPRAGDSRHTWVVPDQHYSPTSSRRQAAIKWAIRSTGHGDAVEEPYDPARGFPRGHLGNDWQQRSQVAQDTTDRLAGEGFTRPAHNSRQSAVFVRPTTTTHHDPYGYGGRDVVHGVYIRPVDKPAQISGSRGAPAWVVGEHHDGTNNQSGSKRFNNLDDALGHAERMHQWIRGGSQGPSPATADAERARFIREIRRPRGPNASFPRTPATVLPGQEELPLHESSYAQKLGGVDDWSDFLRG